VKTISKALIENDKRRSGIALKILKKHFKPNTELYREFRLMNALVKTTVSSEHVAASILKEAKVAATSHDEKKLDREKSLLIRSINHDLNDDQFYDQQVNEYKLYATVQTLINEWRSTEKDLQLVGNFEDQLMKHLVSEKETYKDSTLTEDSDGTARLLMKVMTKKLNEKYNGLLNEQQRSLVRAYAYSTAASDSTSVKKKLHEIKSDLLQLIDSVSVQEEFKNNYTKEKLEETRRVIVEETLTEVDDSTVTRFMLYSRLKDELESKE
jgi:hypothetical protein